MLYTDAQINNLLLNDQLAAAAARVREQIKGSHHHFEEATIAEVLAERDSKWVSELELERSPPGLLNVMTRRLLGQAEAPDAALLRRVVALAAEKEATEDSELRTRMRKRAKAMEYGTKRRDYIAAVRDGREPGDQIALELLAALLHLHVRLLREDGTQEKEIKCAAPVAELHLLSADNTFSTLVVPYLKGVERAAPADGVPKPPSAWRLPVAGEQMEVEVEVVGWCPANVITVLADGGQLLMRINSSDGEVWDDWFTWENEGTDWKRPPLPLATDAVAAAAPASPVTVPASPDASDDTGSSPPTRPVEPHAGSGGVDRPTRAGRAIAAAAAINSGGGGGGDATSDGGGGVVYGGPRTRPRGRAPRGKAWNGVTGTWEGTDEARAEAQVEGAQAVAVQPVAQEEGGGDGVTDLSQLHGAVKAFTERHLTPVSAPPDEPAEPEATKLSLEPPEQPTKMVALLAQCSAVEAEGVGVGVATAACLKMCADKEGALYAHMDKLESKVVQAEEEQQKLEVCNQSLQQAGLDTNEVRAKLNDTNSSVDQLRRELVACGEALAVVQSLPEQLQQVLPLPPTSYTPGPPPTQPPVLPPALATATTLTPTSQSPPTPLAGVARAPGAQRGGGGPVQGAAGLRDGASRRAEALRGSGGVGGGQAVRAGGEERGGDHGVA